MEISEDVRQAAQNVLDKYLPSAQRWTKGHYTARNRRVCNYQAIDQLECSPLVKGALFRAVAEVIAEQYPKLGHHCFCEDPSSSSCTAATIIMFNDHWSIRYADVRRVLEKVIAG